MRMLCTLLAPLLVTTAAAQSVNDVGLTMDGGILTVIYGQICGPVSCAPFPAGAVHCNDRRTLTHYGAMNTPYVVAIGMPAACWQFPGIANQLLLLPPVTPLAIGVCAQPSPTSVCPQWFARIPLVVPPTGPIGFAFRLQSLGVGNAGIPAFGPALDVTLL